MNPRLGNRRVGLVENLLSTWYGFAFTNCIYFYALYLVNSTYAVVEHSAYGYELTVFSVLDLIILVSLILIGTIAVPKRFDKPSALFLIVFYWFILVPYQVLGLTGAGAQGTDRYLMLFVIHFAYAICAKTCSAQSTAKAIYKFPSKSFIWILLALWAITSIILYWVYRDIMQIVGLDQIYGQRELGRSRNFWEGYLQTYNNYVFSLPLVAFGCYYRKLSLIVIGCAGAILNYSITAEKTSLFYPFFIAALFFMVSSKLKYIATSAFMGLSLSGLLFFAIIARAYNSAAEFLTWYLGVRTLLTPGQQIILYYDYFTPRGPTYFSHIRGIDLLVAAPDAYKNDPRWPGLGYIIGEGYLNIPTLNSNANFIATDGIAGFGYVGVLVIFVLIGLLLTQLDRFTNGIDPALTLPVLLTLALTLTNGSIFTALTSFGGFFWGLMFLLMFKSVVKKPIPRP